MDYAAIKARLGQAPYVSMAQDGSADIGIAAAMQAETIGAPDRVVPIAEVMDYLRTNGLWLPIKAAAVAGTSIGAAAAVDLNDDLRFQTIDFNRPIVGAMLADLVAKSLLTQAQSDALVAMKTQTRPFARDEGDTITADVIARARL